MGSLGSGTVLGPPPVGMGGPPPGGPPPPPPGGAKKKGKGALIGAIAGGTVLAAGGFALYWFVLRTPPLFPCDPEKMPEDTMLVARSNVSESIAGRAGIEKGDVPDQAKWSYFAARMCQGKDIFATLMHATDKYDYEQVMQAIAEKKDTSKYLTCGQEAAKETEDYIYQVSYGSKGKGRDITVIKSKLEELPATAKKPGKWKVKGLSPAACFLDGEKDECKDDEGRGIGRVEDTNLWIQGEFKGLQGFAEDFSGRKKVSKDVEKIQEVGKKVAKANSLAAGTFETFRPRFAAELGAADYDDSKPPEGGGDAEDTEKKEKEEKKLEKAGKTFKEIGPFWSQGFKGKKGEGTVEYYFLCSKEGDAKELAEALTDVLDIEKSRIKKANKRKKEQKKEEEEKKDDTKKDKKENKVEKAYRETLKAVAQRAHDEAEIKQDGEWVIITFEFKPDDGEKGDIQAYLDQQKEKIEAASKVVDALLNNEKPEKDFLKTLGGKDMICYTDCAGEDKDKRSECVAKCEAPAEKPPEK